jgi:tetratricopeptide (TPR) repeat protein
MRAFPILLILMLAACGPSTEAPPPIAGTPPETAERPYLFDTLGPFSRPGVSAHAEAQRWFDQGLILAYAFNHDAAGRAFAEAAKLDPDCVLCIWGEAMVLGPNINLPMLEEAFEPAYRLSQQALAMADRAKPVERALIEALALRYAWPAPEDRTPLDRAYAEAMAQVVRDFPDDLDAATMYAEALMDLVPWAYWSREGEPSPYTADILATLESVLARDPDHIGAIHYYIHATEAGPEPEKAEAPADRLAALSPGAGHLVHMPAHTYMRIGRYHDASLTNLKATEADAAFMTYCRGSSGVYPMGYVPHNWHFLSMSAGLEGASGIALRAAEHTAARTDRDMLAELHFMQHFLVTPLFAEVRFGQWDKVLAREAPPADLPFPRAIWHYARGRALAAEGQAEAAGRELLALEALAAEPEMATTLVSDLNHAASVLAVAEHSLRGMVARADGDLQGAAESLAEAARLEDLLNYFEPPDWPLPNRHLLGAVLLEAGDPVAAEAVYRDDLRVFPKNGWSLYGLGQALGAQNREDEAEAVWDAFAEAWTHADVKLAASHF